MSALIRFGGNPIFSKDVNHLWEKEAVFNGSVLVENNKYHLLYRAVSLPKEIEDKTLELSTIGYANSTDKANFKNRHQLIKPEFDWEKFGCEDPRIGKLNDRYFIFYTALSTFPPSPEGIKIALAITSNFHTIEEKHQVTTFNSKAMALFPEKINGQIAAILTADTDLPPSKIGLAFFNEEKDIYNPDYWRDWYAHLNDHTLPLLRDERDHLEVGAPPLLTKKGWLVIYCYIKNYRYNGRTFGIEAVLLDKDNPKNILGRTSQPLMMPEKPYELYGKVPNVIFPSGAIIDHDYLGIYYGAADETICLATCPLDELLNELSFKVPTLKTAVKGEKKIFKFEENPIIKPNPANPWEKKFTFNPGAIYLDNKVHILYRAMGEDDTSVMGYAASFDGRHIDERLPQPVYVPREEFEKKYVPGNSGCEDCRLTKINDRVYMCYTAYTGEGTARVTITSISVSDFLKHNWQWDRPVIISPPAEFDKNACVLSEQINGQYVFMHRLQESIWMDFTDSLKFDGKHFLHGEQILRPRSGKWDSEKVGIGPPPMKTKDGWLLIYHGVCKEDKKYRLGAALLWLENPAFVLSRLNEPIIEPNMPYENQGFRPGTVFSCGSVIIKDEILVYYGAADQVVCGASINLPYLLSRLKKIA